MDEKDIEKILRIILDNLKGKEFNWRLEGSANLKIQEVDVSVRDLDIATDDEGIEIFRTTLKKFIVKDFFSEKVKGSSLVCDITGFEVEINSYGDKELNMFDKIKKVTWQNLQIPLLPLESAKKFYEMINRKEKAHLISKHLSD